MIPSLSSTSQIGEGTSPEMISLNGHPGHLTQSQEDALKTFKINLEKAELYTPEGKEGESRLASHDDVVLLRYLRARRFDPTEAQKQFASRCAWEKEHDVHRLFANFPTDEFENARRYYPRWTGRRDRYGRPLYVYKLSALSGAIQEELNDVTPERRYQRIVVLYEVMTRFVSPLCTLLPHPPHNTPIAAVTTIIDLSGVSLTQMWTLRSHLREASELANANYPETLGAVAVVNAPGFFAKVWGWIKGWFDKATREKIRVLGHVGLPTANGSSGDVGEKKEESEANRALQELVDKKNLPKEYGGEMEWSFFDEPCLDEEAKEAIGGGGKMPRGPWIFDPVDNKVKRPAEYEGEEKVWPPGEASSGDVKLENGHANGQVNGLVTNGSAVQVVDGV